MHEAKRRNNNSLGCGTTITFIIYNTWIHVGSLQGTYRFQLGEIAHDDLWANKSSLQWAQTYNFTFFIRDQKALLGQHDTQDLHLLRKYVSIVCHAHRSWSFISKGHFQAGGPNSHVELVHIHAPLRVELHVVVDPPLAYMLKPNGWSYLATYVRAARQTCRGTQGCSVCHKCRCDTALLVLNFACLFQRIETICLDVRQIRTT